MEEECKDFLIKSGLNFAKIMTQERNGMIIVYSNSFYYQIVFMRKEGKYNFNNCVLSPWEKTDVKMTTVKAIERILHEYNVLKGN